MKKSLFALLIVLIFLFLTSCAPQPGTQPTERINQIPVEQQTIAPTKTKIELPTLIPTDKPTPTPTVGLKPSSTMVPTQTPFTYHSPTPSATPECNCNEDFTCDLFSKQKDAQFCFEVCYGTNTESWLGLDPDQDGKVCEELR